MARAESITGRGETAGHLKNGQSGDSLAADQRILHGETAGAACQQRVRGHGVAGFAENGEDEVSAGGRRIALLFLRRVRLLYPRQKRGIGDETAPQCHDGVPCRDGMKWIAGGVACARKVRPERAGFVKSRNHPSPAGKAEGKGSEEIVKRWGLGVCIHDACGADAVIVRRMPRVITTPAVFSVNSPQKSAGNEMPSGEGPWCCDFLS